MQQIMITVLYLVIVFRVTKLLHNFSVFPIIRTFGLDLYASIMPVNQNKNVMEKILSKYLYYYQYQKLHGKESILQFSTISKFFSDLGLLLLFSRVYHQVSHDLKGQMFSLTFKKNRAFSYKSLFMQSIFMHLS